MHKLISTKNRIFISLVGPSVSGKTYLIHEWLKVGTFQPKLDIIYFSYQHPQPLFDVMQREIDKLEFVQGIHFEFINSLKNNGSNSLLFFDDSCAAISTVSSLWTLLPPADFADLVLKTFNTNYSTKLNYKGMLSFKTRSLFFSSHLEICIELLQ